MTKFTDHDNTILEVRNYHGSVFKGDPPAVVLETESYYGDGVHYLYFAQAEALDIVKAILSTTYGPGAEVTIDLPPSIPDPITFTTHEETD